MLKLDLATITSTYVLFKNLIKKDCLPKQKVVYYINYKKTNDANFLKDVKNCGVSLRTDDLSDNYGLITNSFIEIVNKHAPLEKMPFGENV